MTSLFPGCGPSCYRKKKIEALKYAKDSEALEVELHGHGWVQAKKEKEATAEADAQVAEYRTKFKEISEVEEPEEVGELKQEIHRKQTLSSILNRLNSFFSKPPSISSWSWWFGVFLDLVITVLVIVVIYLIYVNFVAGRMVGGKRLGK